MPSPQTPYPRRNLVVGVEKRGIPREASLESLPGLVERVAQMLLDLGMVGILLSRPLEGFDRLGDLAALELGPAERIGDRGIVRGQLARLADQRFSIVHVLAALELCVAEEIEQQRLVGGDGEPLLEGLLGFGPAVGFL